MTRLLPPAKVLLLVLVLRTVATLHAQSDKPQAGTYSLLYSFQCAPDGLQPESGLVRDSSGNLYGTTIAGGEYGYGTVFKVTPDGTESILHSFGGSPLDGSSPFGITLDPGGNIYGITPVGGEFDRGSVFKVTATGREGILYSFCPDNLMCTDGLNPAGGIARDSAGNLYGTAQYGGIYGYGAVFKLTPGGTFILLHSFPDSQTDGLNPTTVTLDSSGNLYGTTEEGGAFQRGTVFQVTPNGSESLLHSFKGHPSDGAVPTGGRLLRDTSGNLYGVTLEGGAKGGENSAGLGVVFKLTAGGTETVLLNFTGRGGFGPVDGLARDEAGNLYGTTTFGGLSTSCGRNGCGVLFELTAAGREIVLHNFTLNSSSDGANPEGGLIRDPSGNLYGTLYSGGAYGCGAVFKYTP